ncbi:MAG: hypothetical protein IIC22_09495 [Chloroflexi bacterium]|nr:hypothetical protein [Chloroflexota bacterium]
MQTPLTRRSEKLERRNHVRKTVIALLLSVTVAVLALGCSLPNDRIVSAEKFILLDEAGEPRAEMFVGANGTPSMDFYDASGNLRIRLGESVDGALGLFMLMRMGMTARG